MIEKVTLVNCADYSNSVFRNKTITDYIYNGFYIDIFNESPRMSMGNINVFKCELNRTKIETVGIHGFKIENSIVSNSDIIDVNFYECEFKNVTFVNVKFDCCSFRSSKFLNCSFRRCNFQDSLLNDDLFEDCSFTHDNLFITPVCPEKGSYIGYKKAYIKKTYYDPLGIGDLSCYYSYIPVIVELKITEDSKRSSATSKKCRASKCEVLSITDIGNKIKYNRAESSYDQSFIYEVGKIVEVDNFDENRWNECSTGIHHFLNREDAVNYN